MSFSLHLWVLGILPLFLYISLYSLRVCESDTLSRAASFSECLRQWECDDMWGVAVPMEGRKWYINDQKSLLDKKQPLELLNSLQKYKIYWQFFWVCLSVLQELRESYIRLPLGQDSSSLVVRSEAGLPQGRIAPLGQIVKLQDHFLFVFTIQSLHKKKARKWVFSKSPELLLNWIPWSFHLTGFLISILILNLPGTPYPNLSECPNTTLYLRPHLNTISFMICLWCRQVKAILSVISDSSLSVPLAQHLSIFSIYTYLCTYAISHGWISTPRGPGRVCFKAKLTAALHLVFSVNCEIHLTKG